MIDDPPTRTRRRLGRSAPRPAPASPQILRGGRRTRSSRQSCAFTALPVAVAACRTTDPGSVCAGGRPTGTAPPVPFKAHAHCRRRPRRVTAARMCSFALEVELPAVLGTAGTRTRQQVVARRAGHAVAAAAERARRDAGTGWTAGGGSRSHTTPTRVAHARQAVPTSTRACRATHSLMPRRAGAAVERGRAVQHRLAPRFRQPAQQNLRRRSQCGYRGKEELRRADRLGSKSGVRPSCSSVAAW